MSFKFRSDATGGAIVNELGNDVLRIDSNGRVTFDAYGGLATTGDFKQTGRTTAPPGWIAGDGGTIGNVGSGATRANVDTLDLFTLWWAQYTDAQLPILTSAGGASTRGASAAVDWAAGKRLTVFDVRDRFMRNAGPNNTNGTKYAGTAIFMDTINDTTLRIAHASTLMENTDGTYQSATNEVYAGGGTNGGVGSGKWFGKVRPDNLALLGCWKL